MEAVAGLIIREERAVGRSKEQLPRASGRLDRSIVNCVGVVTRIRKGKCALKPDLLAAKAEATVELTCEGVESKG